MIKGLHHIAFRCRDAEETRAFYEEVVGLPLATAFEIAVTKTGRPAKVLHIFFELADGSFVAFFEEPGEPFEFRSQRDFDLHLALEADEAGIERAVAAARTRGLEVRGPSDHDFITSWYLRDPNGYVVELSLKSDAHDAFVARERAQAHEVVARWTNAKTGTEVPAP